MSDLSTLAKFLSASKEKYLKDVHDHRSREWIVTMGNEAGGTIRDLENAIIYAHPIPRP